MRLATVYGTLGVMLLAAPVGAQRVDVAPPTLVRCAARASDPCLRLRATRGGDGALVAARDDAWTVRLGDVPLAAPTIARTREVDPCLRLLVLADVSGSMEGPRVALLRDSLRAWIDRLPTHCVRMAVAPFSSVDVERRIRSVHFGEPRSAARDVAALPAPLGNTGLYSAITIGAQQVAGDGVAMPREEQRALLVVTDGVNDVAHPGDDPGLLDDVAGLRVARSAVAASGARLFVVRMGVSRDVTDMTVVAGDRGRAYAVGDSPFELGRALDDVAAALQTTRVLTVPLTAAQHDRLARGALPVTLVDGDSALAVVSWRPPLVALPPIDAGAGTDAAGARRDVGSAIVRRRVSVAGGLAMVLAALAFGVPLMVGDPVRRDTSPRTARAPGTRPVAPPADRPLDADEVEAWRLVRGLRRDVHDAPPRRPLDVTAPGI